MAETRTDSVGLNSSQRLHLLSSAQHADKLLAEVESILTASRSRSAFPKYKNPLPPAQAKVVEDYLSRIRAQIVHVLESQDVAVPEPGFESVHSMRVTLAFIRIAFQECTPDRMRGYGEVAESNVRALNGLVDEMIAAVDKLDAYLAQGLAQDLESRLENLARAGADLGFLPALQRIVANHGLVEFRQTLAMILDRLESKNFEIALFGRVSSGKSSLLNHIVDREILPVGVNPITAVPTRLVFGDSPRLSIWYADRSPERTEITRLPEFVSEQQNPANSKHVTRIVAELPSARLRDGVVLVDTPGLGSLATSGAAETLAYLPRCDLGVVLIDAGSTLTEDDLATVRTLYEAGIPASLLLSKSDLLNPADRAQSLRYISEQVRSQLGLTIPIHAVSIGAKQSSLLEAWLTEVLLPLYERHQQFAQESLRRKIGSLRGAVVTALRLRLDRAPSAASVDVNQIDSALRHAVGRIAEVRDLCVQTAQTIRDEGGRALEAAAAALNAMWSEGAADATAVVDKELVRVAAESSRTISTALNELATALTESLRSAADALGFENLHQEENLRAAIKEMPRLDAGDQKIDIHPTLLMKVVKRTSVHQIHSRLTRQIGTQVDEAFLNLGRMLDSWIRQTLSELQRRFEAHADAYRAHLHRLRTHTGLSSSEQAAIRAELAALGASAEESAEAVPVR